VGGVGRSLPAGGGRPRAPRRPSESGSLVFSVSSPPSLFSTGICRSCRCASRVASCWQEVERDLEYIFLNP